MEHAGIKHLEDLDIDKFVWCITNLDKFLVTEKIDGSELIFGLDDYGNFYTSREAKSGKRFYSESQWPKQFWTTGFRGAHKVLESNQHILKLLMNPGDSIEVEILYGPTPNTIPYNSDGYNRIVFLRPISGDVDIQKINDKINACLLRGIKIDLENVPHTENGWDYSIDNIAEQHWKFETVPTITLDNLPRKEIDETFSNNKSLLEKSEFAKQRITKTNKVAVEETRKKLQEFKTKIKNSLVKALVENRSSVFGPTIENGGWIEGLVFRDSQTNFQFKLVNKEKFTRINEENHHYIEYLREEYWKKFKQDVYETCNITKEDRKKKREFFEDYKDLANKNFGKDLNALRAEIQQRCWYYMNAIQAEYQTLPLKKEYINNTNCQRVFEEFSGTRKRFMQMISKSFTATQPEHLLELVLTEDIVVDHKKHFHEDCRRIHRKEIKETLKYVSKITKIPYDYLKENLLGNTGKSETSGDLDICVESFYESTIKKNALKHLKENHIFESKGLNIIHLIVPIEGKQDNGNVQVDLMLSENLDWTKFYYDSNKESKYKGLYRNALLRAMTAATNQTRTIGEELVGRSGFVLIPNKGLEYQIKERPPSKNGGFVKAFKVMERRHVTSDPQRVLDFIFHGEFDVKISPDQVRTFESLLELARKFHEDKIELIEMITCKIIKDLKYKIPEELVHARL